MYNTYYTLIEPDTLYHIEKTLSEGTWWNIS